MSLISRLKAVVAGDDYLDDDFEELDYPTEDDLNSINDFKQKQKNGNALSNSNPFDFMNTRSSNVVGMPGISSSSSEVNLMEPRSFDEMINTNEPVIFDCRVDPTENCFPMIPSGKPHNQMLLGPEDEKEEVSDEGKTLV